MFCGNAKQRYNVDFSDMLTVSKQVTISSKLFQKSEENADWKNYKDDLTKVIINGKKSDTNFTAQWLLRS